MGKVRKTAKDHPKGTPVLYRGRRARVVREPFHSPKSRGTMIAIHTGGRIKVVPLAEVEPRGS